MLSSTEEKGPVVVRLLDGESERQELVLEVGRSTAPFALGTRAGWRIEGRDVADAHVMIAWNGTRLFVGSVSGREALLDGFPLAPRWTEVRVPSELRFGGARLSIARHPRRPDGGEPEAVSRSDEATSSDDERLQAALQLSREEEATCIAEVIAPAEARLPTKGIRTTPDSDRTIVASVRSKAIARLLRRASSCSKAPSCR